MKNNLVTLSGCIVSKFTYSHEVFGEKFFTAYVTTTRTSETIDLLPVLFSERIINTNSDYIGRAINITGEFRSYNQPGETRNHLLLYIFVLDYQWADYIENINSVFLEGFLCKPPIYRKTPLGREIADVLLAVNRPYGKSDYIPCICWGRNARFAEGFQVGEHIQFWGRIQSREYTKNEEKKIAYELSVSKLEVIE